MNAPRAASLVISLHNHITAASTKVQLKTIMAKIQVYLPSAPQRVYVSYAWLLFCTFLVSTYIKSEHFKSVCLMKLLDSVGLKEELEHQIWIFFKQHVCEAITKYQLEEVASQDKLTSEKFENMLCEVVADVEAREV